MILYKQEIVCESCKKMMGYAPYFREDYQCLDCHKNIQREVARDCEHDWIDGPTTRIQTCYDCLTVRDK
jgi:hypothetical protein